MASNFRILMHNSSESLHLKLVGDFDVASAQQLIDIIIRHRFRVNKIFIHTSCLDSIHPFGADELRNNLRSSISSHVNLVFTGEKADAIAYDIHKPIVL
jgi:hypothetical protein